VVTGPGAASPSRPRHARATRALGDPVLRTLLPVHAAVGVALGALPVAALHTALASGDTPVAGQVGAALFGSSFLGGLAYAATRPAPAHLPLAAAGFTAGLVIVPFAAHRPLGMLAAAVLAGVWFAPLLTAGQLRAAAHVPPHARAESAGWLIGALGAGEAAGTALAAATRVPAGWWPPLAAGCALLLLLCTQACAPRIRSPHRTEPYDAFIPAPRCRRSARTGAVKLPAVHCPIPGHGVTTPSEADADLDATCRSSPAAGNSRTTERAPVMQPTPVPAPPAAARAETQGARR
jgi:hypothetical protein